MWRATALTLFPEMFPGVLGHSLLGRALSVQPHVVAADGAEDRHQVGARHPSHRPNLAQLVPHKRGACRRLAGHRLHHRWGPRMAQVEP